MLSLPAQHMAKGLAAPWQTQQQASALPCLPAAHSCPALRRQQLRPSLPAACSGSSLVTCSSWAHPRAPPFPCLPAACSHPAARVKLYHGLQAGQQAVTASDACLQHAAFQPNTGGARSRSPSPAPQRGGLSSPRGQAAPSPPRRAVPEQPQVPMRSSTQSRWHPPLLHAVGCVFDEMISSCSSRGRPREGILAELPSPGWARREPF